MKFSTLAMIAASAQANIFEGIGQSKCKFLLQTFSDNSCSTLTSSEQYEAPVGYCHRHTEANGQLSTWSIKA